MHGPHIFLTFDSIEQSSCFFPNFSFLLCPIIAFLLFIVLYYFVFIFIIDFYINSMLFFLFLKVVDVDIDRSCTILRRYWIITPRIWREMLIWRMLIVFEAEWMHSFRWFSITAENLRTRFEIIFVENWWVFSLRRVQTPRTICMVWNLALSCSIASDAGVPPVTFFWKFQWVDSIFRWLFCLILGNCEVIVLIRQRKNSMIEFVLIKWRSFRRRDRVV